MSEYYEHPLAQQDTFARESKPKPTHYRKRRAYRFKTITLSNQEIDTQFSTETFEHPYSHLADTHNEDTPEVNALDLLNFCCIDKSLERQRKMLVAQFHRDLQARLNKLSLEIAQELDLRNLIAALELKSLRVIRAPSEKK